MPRSHRIDVAGEFYHCLNRAAGKKNIFVEQRDYRLLETIIEEAVEITGMRILAYCIMPNHFHFVLHPRNDGDLSVFMKMVTLTHAQRYRTMSNTIGEGPVYQGRYKSFIIQDDTHLFTVLRYVERNPLTARLVDNPLDWKYSSLYRRHVGTEKQKETLSPWIIDEPSDYLKLMEQPLSLNEREKLELSENKGVPYGDEQYIIGKVGQYGLESTVRGKGRPKKR